MLRQKHIAGDVIAKGIKVIDEDEYKKVLEGVALNKWKTYSDDDEKRVGKLNAFLQSRGYEPEIIREVIKDIEQ